MFLTFSVFTNIFIVTSSLQYRIDLLSNDLRHNPIVLGASTAYHFRQLGKFLTVLHLRFLFIAMEALHHQPRNGPYNKLNMQFEVSITVPLILL